MELLQQEQQKPVFVLPVIHDNPDGWGPNPAYIPEKFQDLPYAPFSKSDKLGRCADWTGQQQYASRGSTGFSYKCLKLFLTVS
jgi:translation initiation factor 3 subunit D